MDDYTTWWVPQGSAVVDGSGNGYDGTLPHGARSIAGLDGVAFEFGGGAGALEFGGDGQRPQETPSTST